MFIDGLATAEIRFVNALMCRAMRRAAPTNFFARYCGPKSPSTNILFEPYAFNGAVPAPHVYAGNLPSVGMNSFSQETPNILLKTPLIRPRRWEIEGDQTLSTRDQLIVDVGLSMLQVYDLQFTARVLKGGEASSAIQNDIRGNPHFCTFEPGIPFYSTAHNWYKGQLQSNVIQSGMPFPYDPTVVSNAALANDIAQAVSQIISRIASFLDDKGNPLFPEFDPENQLNLIFQPSMRQAAELALGTRGAIIGAGPGASGATTAIAYRYVRSMATPSYFGPNGVVDVDLPYPSDSVNPPARVKPTYADTQFWWFITDTKRGTFPMYPQLFRPIRPDQVVGKMAAVGYSPQEAFDGARSLKIDIPTAEMYAAMEIDNNFAAIGAQAQESVVTGEAFFASARAWSNFAYGLPWLAGTVLPAGQSAP